MAVLPVCETVEIKAKCLNKISKDKNKAYGKSFLPFFIQSVSTVCTELMLDRGGHAFGRRRGHLQLVTLLLG